MAKIDDLAVVIQLACLTEDRTNSEQRALLRIARAADKKANANTITNTRMWGQDAGMNSAVRQRSASKLEQLVDRSRVLVDNQTTVRLPAKR